MLHRLKLTKFRQHKELEINFQEGMNVIRGRNEAGKSTIIEAICYVLFGLRAIEVTLEDLVTWGYKDTELKGEVWITLSGEDLYIKRSKSGAELVVDGSATIVTGQAAVTEYVEKLIGVSTAMAPRLVMAKQNDVRGAIEEGAEAVKLIERLSNLGLIDTILGLVQTTLPNGNTNMQEQMILQTEKELAVPILDRSAELRRILQDLENNEFVALAQVENYKESMLDAVEVTRRHERLLHHRAQHSLLLTNIALQQTIVDRGLPEDGDKSKVEAWQQAVADDRHSRNAWEGLQAVRKLCPPPVPHTTYAVQIMYNEAMHNRTRIGTEIGVARTELAVARIGVMKSQTCQWCKVDVTTLPQFKENNDLSRDAVSAWETKLAALEHDALVLDQRVKELKPFLDADSKLRTYCGIFSQYMQMREGGCPAAVEWMGPAMPQLVPDFTTQIRAEQIKLETFARAATARGIALTDLDKLQRRLAELGPVSEAAIEEAERDVKLLTSQKQTLSQLNLVYLDLQPVLRTSRDALSAETARIKEVTERRQRDLAQLDTARAAVVELKINNQLIKKLKLAKPVIADQLWAAVTAVVGDYFSEMRGVVSVVEKSEIGFTVDGKPVLDNLSGSTLDALGLAVRMGLTKTFLPNTRFLVLDEVAAGMDDNREGAMLGLLASFGMDQTIVITHSALADSFANNVILLEDEHA